MEIRLTASGNAPLATKVFFCDEEGFEVDGHRNTLFANTALDNDYPVLKQ